MDEAAYRASSFLGGSRLVTPGGEEFQVPLAALVQRHATNNGPMHFLFHIGHCGSTLLSRMLGEIPGLFSLREPRPLMSLAQYRRCLSRPGYRLTEQEWREYLHAVLALLSRTWDDHDIALVKPNSHSNNQMTEELEWASGRVLLLQVGLETWLATVLKLDKRDELRHFSELRIADLRDRFPDVALPPTQSISDAERAAITWLTQMLEFHEAGKRFGERCLRVDFDQFLEQPGESLARITHHLAVETDGRTIDHAVSLLADRHAKHPDQAYGTARRTAELAQTRERFAAEISAAQTLIQSLRDEHPALAAAAQETS